MILLQAITAVVLLFVATPTLGTKRVYNNLVGIEKNAAKEFQQLYWATKDLAGSSAKVTGAPSVILSALSGRLQQYIPGVRRYSTGCRVPANDVVGPGSLASYDMLLKYDDGFGQCKTPAEASFMEWRGDYPDRLSYEEVKNLPPVEDVWERLFERRGPPTKPEPGSVSLNFWFISFVNWFHDDNFKTASDTDGTYTWSSAVGMRLTQVYGHTEERQRVLRLGIDGKMKTQTIGSWDFFPPSLETIQAEDPTFVMWTPESGPLGTDTANRDDTNALNTTSYFAIGDPRFNMHPGHIMWASIALYLHNNACDAILSSDPELNDEEVFQRARTIVFHLVQTTRLHNFISDSVAHTRDHFRLVYDPTQTSLDLGAFLNFKGGQPNYIEFNHIYQAWHSFVPDGLRIHKEKDTSMGDLMWNPELFHTVPLSKIAAGFTKTPVAKYGPHSFLPFLKNITIQALKDERSQRMQGYNQYRTSLGLDPLKSFDQLGVKNPEQVAEMYNFDIDQLELLPGILADNAATLPENLLGDMQLIMVALLAIEDLVSNEVVSNPVLWSESYLTEGGVAFLKLYDFADVLALLLDGTMETPACVFRSSDDGCRPQGDFVPFFDAPRSFMSLTGVCSFVGVDLTRWFFDNNGYARSAITSTIIANAVVAILYFGLTRVIFRQFLQTERPVDWKDIVAGARLVVLAANTIVTLLLFIPMTMFWVDMVGSPQWVDDLASGSYQIGFMSSAVVSSAFLAEIVMRLVLPNVSSFGVILWHHVGYYYICAAVFISTDIFVLKMSTTLLWGFAWEWPMYLSYFCIRVYDLGTFQSNSENGDAYGWYRYFLRFGFPTLICVYFWTRVMETVVVVQLLVCGTRRYFTEHSVDSTPFWILAPVAPLFLSMQFRAGVAMLECWRHRSKQETSPSLDQRRTN